MAAQIRVAQVDVGTGELLEGAALAVIYPKRKNGFQTGGWLAMSQHELERLAALDLGDQARRVFMLLCARLDFENFIRINQAELARILGMKPPNFSRALKRLVVEGIVVPGPVVSGHATYRLCPAIAWKGSAKTHHQALKERIKASGLSVHQGGK